MNQTPRYQPLSPAGLAVAFGVLGLLSAFSMGGSMMMYGRGPMMGPYGPTYYHPGALFGLLGGLWLVIIAALGGAIAAWVYNAVVAARVGRQ
ncbi:hypothetical protein EPN52_12605 [bacterium]|nr:MAG: hypothetical protein EPN52_12605 [bacterium]